MAIPTMTNNSPSAGYIAWGSFTIQYQGVSYVVGAGSSNQRWVWWRYNAGSPVIEAGADIPTTLTDDDLVLFGNKNGISLRVQSAQVLDGELIVDGSIFADAIAANQISTSHISTLGLDAATIKFGTMSGDRISVGTLDGSVIKANTILSSQLIVTDFENNLDNPKGLVGTVGGSAPGWGYASTIAPVIASATLPDGSTGQVLQITGNGTLMESLNKPITVSPNDEFWISGYVRKVSGTDTVGTVSFLANTTNLTDGTIDYTSATAAGVSIAGLTSAWTLVTGSVKMPAKAYRTYFRISVRNDVSDGVYQFYDLQVRRKSNGNLIVDGSITSTSIVTTGLDAAVIKFGTMSGDRITVNTIASSHIVTAGLDAGVIKFGSMDGGRITVNTLNGDRILANTITAAKIVLGDSSNLVRDPSADSLGTWTLGTGWSVLTVGAPSSPNDKNSNVFRYTANNTYSAMYEPMFPVDPGDQYFLSYYIRYQNTLAGSCSIAPLFFFYDKTGTFLSALGLDNASTSLTSAWALKSSQVTVPAGAAYGQINVRATAGLTGGLIDIDQIDIRRQVVGTLLEPNLILSTRIATTSTAALDLTLAKPVLTLNTILSTGGVFPLGVYRWVVQAVSAAGSSLRSNEITATAVSLSNSFTMSWPRVVGAVSYNIFRTNTADQAVNTEQRLCAQITDTGASSYSYTDVNGTPVSTATIPVSSGRMEMTTTGLQAYDQYNIQTLSIASATGNVSIKGEFGTGDPAGAGVRISSSTFFGIYGQSTYPTIVWNNGSQALSGNRQPQIFTDMLGNTNLYIWGGAGNTSKMPQVKLDVGLIRLGFEASVGTNEVDGVRIQIASTDQIDSIAAIVKTWGEHQVTGAVQMNGSLQTGASGGFQFTTSGGSAWKAINTGDVNVNGALSTTGSIASGNNLSMAGPTTGSFTANCSWNSSTGGIRVNTSSRRFKENIRDARINISQALKLTPRQFERNDGEPEDAGKTFVGFIAEEADELGLTDWVVYDSEGPWSFGYDQWVVALQAIAQHQNTEIADLKATVSDQNARLEALERKLEEITS